MNSAFQNKLEQAKLRVTDAETTVAVLKRLLNRAEWDLSKARALVSVGEKESRPAERVSEPDPLVLTNHEDRMTEAERKAYDKAAHDEKHMDVNHRSGCALNSSDLREKLLTWMRGHGVPGTTWIPRSDLIRGVEGWLRWGKKVVDSTIDSMEENNEIIVRSDGDRKYVQLIVVPRNEPTVSSVLSEIY